MLLLSSLRPHSKTIVSGDRIETSLTDNLIKVGEILLSEISDHIQIIDAMSLEIEITMDLNFSDPPMHSDLHLGNHQ